MQAADGGSMGSGTQKLDSHFSLPQCCAGRAGLAWLITLCHPRSPTNSPAASQRSKVPRPASHQSLEGLRLALPPAPDAPVVQHRVLPAGAVEDAEHGLVHRPRLRQRPQQPILIPAMALQVVL